MGGARPDRPPAAAPPPRAPYSGQFPVQEPAPDAPPQAAYSGQFPVQEPRAPYSGQFPTQPPLPQQSGALPRMSDDERAYRESGPAPAVPDQQDRRSGTFPTAPASVYQSGAYAMPPVAGQAGAAQQSGAFAYPGEVTGTGRRRAIVAPDAGFGSLLTDRPALAFLLVALAFAGAMIAYIALRYSHFPDQIALHFGPAGSSQPTRIGEKRELWTIPFIVGIVLAADTALAWAVYRFDRFAARLLTLGSALVAAIAWVVLLTVLHR